MYISTNWIKDYVDLEGIDVDALIYNFTMSTAEVEGCEKYGYDTTGIVVGQIESIEDVENSTKLHKVVVNIGTEKVHCVCGATNIFVGAKVPFAPAGAKVQSVEITKAMLNGIPSNGMCLSEKELGISADHSGVMILSENEKIGQDIKEIIPLEDTVFEVDNKSITNRPDLWGHYGIAREIAAITKRELKPLNLEDLSVYDNLKKLDITVDNAEECFRYTGITVENVKRNESPYKMRVRLFYAGMRSINLLADITNYVMLEIGQPMHAFDSRLLEKVVVKSLEKETEFVTLDGVVRKLPVGTLMINNEKTPVGIAGIMGGLDSEIVEDTTALFLESATFDSTLIRKTATKLGHRTDASARYEKTLDPEFAKIATARFISILKEIEPSVKVTSAFTDIYLKKYPTIYIDIEKAFFDKYIGIELGMDKIVETLTNLKFIVERNENKLRVEVPTFRATKDVSAKADLIEEVARIHGYDNIKPQANLWETTPVQADEIHTLEYETKKVLATKYGASEIHSYIWYNDDQNRELELEVEDNIKIVNGLNKADSILRANMGPTMLYALNNNLRFMPEAKVFEIGRTFSYNFNNENCKEYKVLGIGLASLKQTEKELMFEAKSMIDSTLKINKNMTATYVQACGSIKYNWVHTKNSYKVLLDNKEIGYIAVVHPKVSDKINKKASVVVAEIRVDNLSEIANNKVKYNPITKYQTVNFDITAIVDKTMKFETIDEAIKKAELEYLLEYTLVDIYENEEKMPGQKSVTVRFNIGSIDKTLSKEEIDSQMKKIIENFEKNNMNLNK